MVSPEIDKLINEVSKLPGLGRRSAQRIALYLLKNKERSLMPLVHTLNEANEKIINCKVCGNIDMIDLCQFHSLQKVTLQAHGTYHEKNLFVQMSINLKHLQRLK